MFLIVLNVFLKVYVQRYKRKKILSYLHGNWGSYTCWKKCRCKHDQVIDIELDENFCQGFMML